MLLNRLHLLSVGVLSVAAIVPSNAAGFAAQANGPKKFALVVGVKDYDNAKLRPLKYTENDVAEMATVLRSAGYQVVKLTSSDGQKDANLRPTRANIDKHLKGLLARCNKADTVLVALAGHGLQFDGIEDNFFCPADAVPLADDDSRKTLLSLKDIYAKLDKTPGAVKLLLVDACRNDPTPGRSVDTGAGRPPAGVSALFSCSSGERAYELDNYRHGLFFYHVLEGLRGKAKDRNEVVTWDALQAYVRTKVSEEAPKLLNGVHQTPSLNAGELRGEPPILIPRDVKLARRAKLAIMFTPLDRKTAERMQTPQRILPQVRFVTPGGAADAMGLRGGDVVRRINGREVLTTDQAKGAVKELSLGERLEVEVWRDKQILTLVGRLETNISSAEEFRRVHELAVTDDAAATYQMGYFCLTGLGTGKDDAQAVQWFRKAALLGLADAQEKLGWHLANGRGVAKDDAEALKWYRKAADQGHAAGQNSVAYFLRNGRGGARKDDGEALKWYRKAADQGHACAENWVGNFYSGGRGGLKKDDAEAVKWYRKAAEQSEPWAQNNLAIKYHEGRGVAKDDVEALKWYRKSAEHGLAAAQTNLGLFHAHGWGGLQKNDAEAVKWYRKAAEQGDSSGQVNLGFAFGNGQGAAKDDAEAYKWYRKAGDQGHSVGQYDVAWCIEHGRGTTQNKAEAVAWYRKAAAQGNADASQALKRLGSS